MWACWALVHVCILCSPPPSRMGGRAAAVCAPPPPPVHAFLLRGAIPFEHCGLAACNESQGLACLLVRRKTTPWPVGCGWDAPGPHPADFKIVLSFTCLGETSSKHLCLCNCYHARAPTRQESCWCVAGSMGHAVTIPRCTKGRSTGINRACWQFKSHSRYHCARSPLVRARPSSSQSHLRLTSFFFFLGETDGPPFHAILPDLSYVVHIVYVNVKQRTNYPLSINSPRQVTRQGSPAA